MCFPYEYLEEKERWLAESRAAGGTPLDEWLAAHNYNETYLLHAGLLAKKPLISTADQTSYTITPTSKRWLRHTCSFDTTLVKRGKTHLLKNHLVNTQKDA